MANNEDLYQYGLRELAARLGLDTLPAPVGADDYLRDLVSDAASTGEAEHWREATNDARRLLAVHRGVTASPGRPKERTAPVEIEVTPDSDTHLRGEVVAELAAAWPDVRSFRREYLQDRLLSKEEAADFLRTDRKKHRRNAAQLALRRLSEDLEHAYGWRAHQARRFVLTGRSPSPVYVTTATHSGREPFVPSKARVTIEVQAWVDAKEVVRAYKAAQQQLLGGDNRKLPERSLEVVRFVNRQTGEDGSRPPWSTMLKQWNREQSEEWSYASYRGLRQAFYNASERLMHPRYNRPKWHRRRTAEIE